MVFAGDGVGGGAVRCPYCDGAVNMNTPGGDWTCRACGVERNRNNWYTFSVPSYEWISVPADVLIVRYEEAE